MHIPVLKEKVLEYLNPQANENFIDCTAGQGGHTLAILERTAPKGKVLAIDWDDQAIKNLKMKIANLKLQQRVVLREGNFAEIQEIVEEEKLRPVHGVLFDLGMSSIQIEDSGRGFSLRRAESLDMRYGKKNPLTAEKIVNYSNKKELERILREYGEERFADKIAQAILQTRARRHISTTLHLVRIVERATPRWYHRRKLHPATKTFQALRIAVNNELENLRQGLKGAVEIVQSGGKIAVISFHSLEDRVIKEFFKQNPLLGLPFKKPITPSLLEIKKNPRARSAKLRVAQKL